MKKVQFQPKYNFNFSKGGYLYKPKDAWDSLSLPEKSEMMKVAVRNGITDLKTIREKYNEFAEGGDTDQKDYYSTMERVAEENYDKWGFNSPDEALVHALNDNTYDYRGYYNKYPQSRANADTHWTDEFKTVWHPTFSNESVYSGSKSQYNPHGLSGGLWIGDTFIPSVWQLSETNKFAEGGIHIKPENRGKFTRLKERTGHSATWFKEHGTPAQKKMATFDLNSRHWKHGLGGNLFSGEEEGSQQMDKPNIFRRPNNSYFYQANPESEEVNLTPVNTIFDNPALWTFTDDAGRIYTPRQKPVAIHSTVTQEPNRNRLSSIIGNYIGELKYDVDNGIPVGGKYTMPAIAANALLPLAGQAVANTTLGGIPGTTWLNQGLTSAFAGHGLHHTLYEGLDGPLDGAMTALEVAPLGALAKPMYEGIVQPGMRLFNSPLTLRSLYSPVIQRSIGSNITTGTNEETVKAVERGRNTLLDWIRSPFYKTRLEDEPLYRFADDVVADAGKMIEEVPIDISKTKLDLDPSGLVNGITKTRPAIQTQLPDGTIIADLNTGLDVSVASDLGKDADETALHELLHYMTANSKGEPISKAGERIVSKGWMNPTETHFDAINIIHKNRSKGWQDYILDQNDALLPQYDPVVKMVMEEPDKAVSFLKQAGRAESDAKSAVQSLRTRYSEWYDIQEQRAYLQQLFHSKIRPNLKNPNDATEIEQYLTQHPEILDNFPAYKFIQEVRPGSLKDYAKYFSAALGTMPFITKISSKDGQ